MRGEESKGSSLGILKRLYDLAEGEANDGKPVYQQKDNKIQLV
jgi:hypothetical protein